MGDNNFFSTFSQMFLSFIGSVFLVSFLILLSLRLSLFSEKHMLKVADQTDYYAKLTSEINKESANFALGSNVPKEILKNVFDTNTVKLNVTAYIQAIYTSKVKLRLENKAALSDKLLQKIEKYAVDKGLEIQSKDSLNTLVDKIIVIYKGYVHPPFLLSFGQKVMNFKKYLTIGLIVSGVLFFLIAIFLLISLHGYIHRLLRFTSYSFVAAGLMGMVVPAVILLKGVFAKAAVGVKSQAMSLFIRTYINSFLWMFVIIGGILLVLGIISAVISERKRAKLIYVR
ncbi:MAG: hypothetical protein LBF32_04535 [Streptococcaceae bacterium]|nr:hypothetical protein [Streptococcaceae bacterium]